MFAGGEEWLEVWVRRCVGAWAEPRGQGKYSIIHKMTRGFRGKSHFFVLGDIQDPSALAGCRPLRTQSLSPPSSCAQGGPISSWRSKRRLQMYACVLSPEQWLEVDTFVPSTHVHQACRAQWFGVGGSVLDGWGLEPGLCCNDFPIWRVGMRLALTHIHSQGLLAPRIFAFFN